LFVSCEEKTPIMSASVAMIAERHHYLLPTTASIRSDALMHTCRRD